MKISYLFPIFKEDDAKKFFDTFLKSKFFQNHKENEVFVVCHKDDKDNLKFLTQKALREGNFKIFVLDKNFSYNDAFKIALPEIKGDVLLYGDAKMMKTDLLFEKMLEKHSKKINIVHVAKRRKKFKQFFFNIFKTLYNIFIRIFSGNEDKVNLISVGLLDKDVLDILKSLPEKCCFLKNVKHLYGFETRTIYIDDIKSYKPNFKTKTYGLISSIVSIVTAGVILVSLILLNIFLETNLQVLNIVGVFLILLCIIVLSTTLPKHIFDVRNRENKKEKFSIQKINF